MTASLPRLGVLQNGRTDRTDFLHRHLFPLTLDYAARKFGYLNISVLMHEMRLISVLLSGTLFQILHLANTVDRSVRRRRFGFSLPLL